jgi:hypothetical protein
MEEPISSLCGEREGGEDKHEYEQEGGYLDVGGAEAIPHLTRGELLMMTGHCRTGKRSERQRKIKKMEGIPQR